MTQWNRGTGFSIPAATINDAANYVPIGIASIPDEVRGKGGSLLVHGDVGAGGALNGFKITWAAVPGGTHTDLVADASLNTSTEVVIASTNNLYQTAANGSFKLLMGKIPAEIGFWAKKATADTTVALAGSIA